MGKHNEAIVEYGKAIQRDPNYIHNYLARAKSYRAIKSESKAEKDESIIREIEAKTQTEQNRKRLFDDYLSIANNLFINGIDKPLHIKFSKDPTLLCLGIISTLIGILYILFGTFSLPVDILFYLIYVPYAYRPDSNMWICIPILLTSFFLIKASFDKPKKYQEYNNKYLSKISEIEQRKQNFGKFYEIYLEAKIRSTTDTLEETTKTLFTF